jgi:hypothetical protein
VIGLIVTRRLHRPAALLSLPLLLAVAFWAPIPRVGDPGIDRVLAEVHERLPGWDVQHATDTWEGGYAVVASCGAREIGFQVVPGHGLPPDDFWLQPNDWYARTRLEEVSDYPTFLIWRAQPIINRTLSCQRQLAQAAVQPVTTAPATARNASALEGSLGGIEAHRRRPVD